MYITDETDYWTRRILNYEVSEPKSMGGYYIKYKRDQGSPTWEMGSIFTSQSQRSKLKNRKWLDNSMQVSSISEGNQSIKAVTKNRSIWTRYHTSCTHPPCNFWPSWSLNFLILVGEVLIILLHAGHISLVILYHDELGDKNNK